MNKWIKTCGALAMAASLLVGGGCTLFGYESPAEQQRRQEDNLELNSSLAPVEAKAMLAEESLVYYQELTNAAGSVLATYRAELPQFDEAGDRKQVFSRINEYYRTQYTAYQEDCKAYFNMVTNYYGSGWDTVALTSTPFNATVAYQILEAPEQYLTMECTYSACDDGKTTDVYQTGEVFLLDTGWALGMTEVFGSNYDAAKAKLMEDVTAWGIEQGILTADATVSFTAEQLTESFGITKDGLILFVDSFVLSANDAGSHIITLPLEGYVNLIPEIEGKEPESGADSQTTGQDVTPDPTTPDSTVVPQVPQLPGTSDASGTGQSGTDANP